MVGALFRGLSFGASLIIAIGAQNAFVIRQGLTGKYLFLTAILCASIDAFLILLGVFGFGVVIAEYTAVLTLAKYFAVIFLVGYGLLALRAAFRVCPDISFGFFLAYFSLARRQISSQYARYSEKFVVERGKKRTKIRSKTNIGTHPNHNAESIDTKTTSLSLKKTILSILAFSFLNPHVYLDTVILLGSIAAQEESSLQGFFALGAITASFLWFFSLSYGASLCARWLSEPNAQRGIDIIIALTMWTIALGLVI